MNSASRLILIAGLVPVLAAGVAAQSGPPPTPPVAPDTARPALASITGTVFDSVHLAPLVGAGVLVEGANRIALTNDRGGFVVDSIPAGTWRVRVEHALLDSMGLSLVTAEFPVAAGEHRTLELAVPSPATLVNVSCTEAQRRFGPSAIIGRLLDAETDEPVDSARVSFVWMEISLTAGVRRVPRQREVLTGSDGVYRICGLPNEVDGTLQAIRRNITTAELNLVFRGEPLIIQGLRIGSAATVSKAEADSNAARRVREAGLRFSAPNYQKGEAVLHGRVVAANGQPIARARVDVEGTNSRSLTNERGEFTLTELPSGTQSVVARHLGYMPVAQPVELTTRAPSNVTIMLSAPAQVLDPVVVEAEADRGLDRVGFNERKRAMSGTFITADDVMKRGPNQLTDVMRTVPQLRVVPSGFNNEYVVESARASLIGANCVRFVLDNAPFEAIYPGDVDRLIPPSNVGAIEVYSGSATPIQFQMAGAADCMYVIIWSKFKLQQENRRR